MKFLVNLKTQEDIIKLATEDGFELDWLINRWDSIINKQENKFNNVSDDEIYAELKRRKANKSAK